MRQNRISNVHLWVYLLLSMGVFVPLAWLFPRQELFEFSDLLIVAIAAGTAVGFHPVAWDALSMPVHRVSAGRVLVVGIVAASVAIVIIFGGLWLWRVYRKPDALIDHVVLGFSRWLLVVGWILAMLATGTRDEQLPSSSYRRAGILVAAFVAASGTIVVIAPKLATLWP